MSDLEKDIKFIEKMIKEYKTFGDLHNPDYEDTDKIYKALENLLERIKELEEENKILKGNGFRRGLYEKDAGFIEKKKVKEGLESIEDYFYRLNGPDEDIEYIRKIKTELLEGEQTI